MQKGLLFSSKPNQLHSFLDKLKYSISLSLIHFYPLAGQLATQKFPHEHACWIHVDCNKGLGARVIHATVDLTVSDILSPTDVPQIVRSLFDLGEQAVNHDGHTRPLLSIQVTELFDGIFIGFTMNHSVADGTSLWHFISTLSEIFLGSDHIEETSISISREPVCKPYFPEGYTYRPILKLPYLEPDEFITRYDPGPLRERIFHFSPDSVLKLKAKANEECGVYNIISSFRALSAFVWRSITRARNLDPDQESSCGLVTNTRPRFDPPFSNDYFGNYIKRAQCTCKVSELLGNDLGWAAKFINGVINSLDDKAIREFYKKLVEAPFVVQPGTASLFYKPNIVLIAGSPKFPMYGPEFGMGKALAVLAGYPNKDDGKVTANPGCEGGGSIDLEVCLKSETMNALELDKEFMSFVS